MKRIIPLLFFFYWGSIITCSVYAENIGKTVETKPKKDAIYHLYLTFDDGPFEGSEDISDVVHTEQIKINVFIIGSRVRLSRKLESYYRLYESNPCVEVGNHSFSHAGDKYRRYYRNLERVYKDFLKNDQVLHLKNKHVRLPGRNMWRLKSKSVNDGKSGVSAADLLFKKGYILFGWDLEWQYNHQTGEPLQSVDDMIFLIEKLLRERKTVTENHLVILCHDKMFRDEWEDTDLKELIDRLRSTGLYEFNHLSEYPQ